MRWEAGTWTAAGSGGIARTGRRVSPRVHDESMSMAGSRTGESFDALDVHTATGLWRVSSSGSTVYYLDLDNGLVVRARGAGSGRFAFDDVWTRLVDVICYDTTSGAPEPGTVRVGTRARYRFDPGPDWPDIEWRLQRIVTEIVRVDPGHAATVRRSYPVSPEGPAPQ